MEIRIGVYENTFVCIQMFIYTTLVCTYIYVIVWEAVAARMQKMKSVKVS